MSLDLAVLGPIAQVVWIDLILSADNAVVIALACRSLPDAQRRLGMALGIAAASRPALGRPVRGCPLQIPRAGRPQTS